MIIHPKNWQSVGQPVSMADLDTTLRVILSEIDCDCLSFSGGLDSSLLLYHLLDMGRSVRTFTMTCDANHPDMLYAKASIHTFKEQFGGRVISRWSVVPEVYGDDLVRAFYDDIAQWTDSIITGDGVDEFMCGYYAHQADPREEVYYTNLRLLQERHLAPLDENSGSTRVYLPYMDKRFIHLMAQIPLEAKVDLYSRKKVLVELARNKLSQEIIERKKYGFGTQYIKTVGGAA